MPKGLQELRTRVQASIEATEKDYTPGLLKGKDETEEEAKKRTAQAGQQLKLLKHIQRHVNYALTGKQSNREKAKEGA